MSTNLLTRSIFQKLLINGEETNYSISMNGAVYNDKLGKFVKTHPMKDRPYVRTTLVIGGKIQSFLVHRLVAAVYIANPDNLNVVDHIDNDSRNNKIENLRWVTTRQNHDHKISQSRQASVLNSKSVSEIRSAFTSGVPKRKLAEQYGVAVSTIDAVVSRKTWKHVAA